MALLESTDLPGAKTASLVEQAQAEVEQIRELIDDVLFLSELETGHEVVALSAVPAMPVLREVAESLCASARPAPESPSVSSGDEDDRVAASPANAAGDRARISSRTHCVTPAREQPSRSPWRP